MKILVIRVQGARRIELFANEKLATVRRLMDLGCFGELSGEIEEWNVLARHETHVLTLAEYLTQAGKTHAAYSDFDALEESLVNDTWEYRQLTVPFSADDFDTQLEEILNYLSDDTVLAVIGDGCYVLVSGNNPIREYQEGSTLDLTPTLLELAGYPLPSAIAGVSWVAGMELSSSAGLSAEDEATLRERLSGLGYI